jgi:hypothetical protein
MSVIVVSGGWFVSRSARMLLSGYRTMKIKAGRIGMEFAELRRVSSGSRLARRTGEKKPGSAGLMEERLGCSRVRKGCLRVVLSWLFR